MIHVDDWVVPLIGKYRGIAGQVVRIEAQAHRMAAAESLLPNKVKVMFRKGSSVKSVIYFADRLRLAYRHEIPRKETP